METTAIHEFNSHITNDTIKDPTPQLVSTNTNSTATPGVPIISNTSVYTTYSRQNTMFINNQRFYPFLRPKKNTNRSNLLSSNNYHSNGLTIAMDIIYPGSDKIKKCFTSFPSYVEAFHWDNSLSYDQKIGYENIPEGFQKAHFDIDVEFKINGHDDNNGKFTIQQLGLDSINSVISSINSIMSHRGLIDYYFIVYSSHRHGKESYHLIVLGYYHVSSTEAKLFYDLVLTTIPDHLKRYVDNSVYKPNQQFRLQGHHKLGKDNTKVLHHLTTWTSPDKHSKEIIALRTFEASLVSFVSGCKQFPSFANPNLVKIKKFVNTDANEYYTSVMDIFNRHDYSAGFIVRDTNGGVISLDSKHTHACPVDGRIHPNENAFLSMSDKKHVYFNCRRGGNVYMGSVGGVITDDDIDFNDVDDVDDTEVVTDHLMGNYCVKHRCFLELCCNKPVIVRDIINPEVTSERVQAQGVIAGLIQQQQTSASVHNGNTLAWTQNIQLRPSNYITRPIISLENISEVHNGPSYDLSTTSVHPSYLEGQLTVPKITTTLISFLERNVKYISGTEYIVEELYNSYDRYRNKLGIKYNFANGHFSKELIALGHTISRKRINGKREQMVLLKRSEQIVQTLVNPSQITPLSLSKHKKSIKKEACESRKSLREQYDEIEYKKLFGTTLDMNETLPAIHTLVGDALRYVLVMKAAMASGKTEAYINELMRLATTIITNSKERLTGETREVLVKYKAPPFLIVSARIPLTRKQLADVSRKLGINVELYSDIEDNIIKASEHPYLCITVDSVHRVRGHYEYLILDEYMMTISQLVDFNNSKSTNSNTDKNAESLCERIKMTPKVIIADAFMEDSSIHDIRKLRNDVVVYENAFPKQGNKTFDIISNNAIGYWMVAKDIRERRKICIACGNKDTTRALGKALSKEVHHKIYKGKEVPSEGDIANRVYKIKYYTADNIPSIDPANEFGLFDCIIFTSVIEAGNSFINLHFDATYGFFSGRSFGPRSACQMLLRVRQTTSNRIYICVNESAPNYPKWVRTKRDLVNYIKYHDANMRKDLMNVIKTSYVSEGIDYEHNYFNWYCDVKYRDMKDKRKYIHTLMRLLKSQGMIFGEEISNNKWMEMAELIPGRDDKTATIILREIRKDMRWVINENKTKDSIEIVNAPDLDEETINIISDKRSKTQEEKTILERYYIKRRYKMTEILPIAERYMSVNKENKTEDEVTNINIEIQAHFIRMVKGKDHTHNNVTMSLQLSGVQDDGETLQIMSEIGKRIAENPVYNSNSNYNEAEEDLTRIEYMREIGASDEMINEANRSLELKLETMNITKPEGIAKRLHNTYILENYRRCMHAVNILRMLGFKKWLRTEEDSINEVGAEIITNIIDSKFEILITYMLRYTDDFTDPPVKSKNDDDSEYRQRFKLYINQLLNSCFNVKVNYFNKSYTNGYYLQSLWQLDNDGIVRPLTYMPPTSINPIIVV